MSYTITIEIRVTLLLCHVCVCYQFYNVEMISKIIHSNNSHRESKYVTVNFKFCCFFIYLSIDTGRVALLLHPGKPRKLVRMRET